MTSLKYILPIVSNVLYVMHEFSLVPLLSYIIDESGTDNVKFWTTFLYLSPYISSIVAFQLHGMIAKHFGYKVVYIFIFVSNIVGNLIQYFGYKDIMLICIGNMISGLSVTTIISQTWLNFLCHDEHSTRMQIIFENSESMGSICGLLVAGIVNQYLTHENSWRIMNLFQIIANFMLMCCVPFVDDPFREHRKMLSRTPNLQKEASSSELAFRDGSKTFSLRSLSTCIMGQFLVGVLIAISQELFSITLTVRYGYSVLLTSLIFISFDIVSITISHFFLLSIIERATEYKMLIVSSCVIGIIYCTIALFEQFYATPYVFIIGIGLTYILEQVPYVILGARSHLRIPEKLRPQYITIPVSFDALGILFGGLMVSALDYYFLYISAVMFGVVGSLVFKFSDRIDYGNKR